MFPFGRTNCILANVRVCVCVILGRYVCISECACVGGSRVGRGLMGRVGCRSGLLPVCVLSTLPSAKSLPMPFVVLPIVLLSCEFYFLCAIVISLTMPIKGNVFEKKKPPKTNAVCCFVASVLY